MRILAIDTSLAACSVAVFENGALLAARSEIIGVGHAEKLAPMAAEALQLAKTSAADIDRVGVVVGPGTFAGVRVGVAFARGFAVGGAMRVAGVVGLRAIAKAVPTHNAQIVAPVIDARRGAVYLAAYDGEQAVVAPCVVPVSEAVQRVQPLARGREILWCGPGAPLVAKDFVAFDAINLAAVAMLARDDQSAEVASPLYLRPPDAAPARRQRFENLLGS
jgi:tRNA threonylcarbamoyladenosine biosynthesis protein TsaB